MTVEDDDTLREPQWASAGSLTDLELLPRRFESLVHTVEFGFADMRTCISVLSDKILPAIDRIADAVGRLAIRVDRLERDQTTNETRLAALEARTTSRKAKR